MQHSPVDICSSVSCNFVVLLGEGEWASFYSAILCITRWSTLKSDWLYSLQPKMEKLYTVSKIKSRSWRWLRPYELLIAKFRLKLKKVGKTTRPFRYDLNQILYNYTVEVTNRYKGLDLMDRVPEELWTEIHETVQETMIKIIPQKSWIYKRQRNQRLNFQHPLDHQKARVPEKHLLLLYWLCQSLSLCGSQ